MDNILARKIQLRHNIDPCKPTGSTSMQGRKNTETSWKKKLFCSEKKVGFTRLSLRFEVRGPRFGFRGPRSEVRCPRFEVRGPRSEVRGPRFEVRGPRPEVRGPRSEVQGSRFEVRGPRFEVRGPRSEVRGPRPEVRRPTSEVLYFPVSLCGVLVFDSVSRAPPPPPASLHIPRFPFRPPCRHSRIAPSHQSSPKAISHGVPSVHPAIIPASLLPTGALP